MISVNLVFSRIVADDLPSIVFTLDVDLLDKFSAFYEGLYLVYNMV